ncbi:MAG: hypothetical protein RL220_556 [Bacteroidota bacterium]|jgi:hypothetical protein
MSINKKILWLSAIATITIASCQKNDDTVVEGVTPVPVTTIIIEEPVAGYTYMAGDTVHVHVQINSDIEMHGYEVLIINDSTSDTVWSVQEHDHAASYHIETEWINNVSDHSDMRVRVNAEVEHEMEVVSEEVHFHCHPM